MKHVEWHQPRIILHQDTRLDLTAVVSTMAWNTSRGLKILPRPTPSAWNTDLARFNKSTLPISPHAFHGAELLGLIAEFVKMDEHSVIASVFAGLPLLHIQNRCRQSGSSSLYLRLLVASTNPRFRSHSTNFCPHSCDCFSPVVFTTRLVASRSYWKRQATVLPLRLRPVC